VGSRKIRESKFIFREEWPFADERILTKRHISIYILLVICLPSQSGISRMALQDKDAKFRLILVESRIHRLARQGG
jgi:hypothetical protein